MKEKLYTIPLTDAFNANDECPFCFVERKLEQDAIDFMLGSAYMESDIREATDKLGFCRHHFQMMYDYGNSLGNALMLKTHIMKLNQELTKQVKSYHATSNSKSGLFSKNKSSDHTNSLSTFIDEKEHTCYICNYYSDTYARYLDTFFHMYKTSPEFKDTIRNSKGFCLHHLKELLDSAEQELNAKQKEELFPILFELTEHNMKRIEEDISWFVDKFDYRNKDADWKNSKDAIPRSIQKIVGGYPADGPYKESK